MNNDVDKDPKRFPITIDREGTWYYRGAEMFRKDILSLFFESLDKDEEGNYFVRMSGEKHYITVEDTPYVVKTVHKCTGATEDNDDTIEILLTDGNTETLDISTLHIGQDNVLYCNVKKGTFDARFSRAAYYQIAEHIDYDEISDSYTINLNGCEYPLENTKDR